MKSLVVLEHEEYPVEIDARDRRAFERYARADLGPTMPKGQLQDVLREIPETYLAWLAFHATKRLGILTMTWPDFEQQLLEVRSLDDESTDGLDPTSRTAMGD